MTKPRKRAKRRRKKNPPPAIWWLVGLGLLVPVGYFAWKSVRDGLLTA